MLIDSGLSEIFRPEQVLTDSDSFEKYGKDWSQFGAPNPLAIVFPESTLQVQSLVKLANQVPFSLVPSGGRTGLSGGAMATNQEVVVSFEKMNKVLDFNQVDRQVHCQAGVITQQLQTLAAENQLFYPVDFASSGSSQIGGNIATNAGGIKVVRYGLTRSWVAGLKVVTGSGEILELNHGLVKNATGYDLRHLFIGSEGTLGLITEATMQLTNPPKNLTVMVLGIRNVASIMKTFQTLKNVIEPTALELFSNDSVEIVCEHKGIPRPFATKAPYYLLVEFENDSEATESLVLETFEHCSNEGWVLDGVMSQNEQQAKTLWRLREDISESISHYSPYKNDLAVKVSNIPAFLERLDQLVDEHYQQFQVLWYGHIGDGNLHLNILKPAEMEHAVFVETCTKVNPLVFQLVKDLDGSISAEHGVGTLKRDYLAYTRSESEIAYMQSLKAMFDPNGIMNPGKIFK
jgi:glycolate oxidase subunit GlcD